MLNLRPRVTRSPDMNHFKTRIKRYLPSHAQIKKMRTLRWLGSYFADPALWAINRNSIARGAGVGVFFTFLPVPLQMLPAAVAAIWVRANLPVATLVVWISNPLTWGLIYAPPYLLGAWLLGAPYFPFDEITIERITQQLGALWLGCMIFSTLLGAGAYFAVHISWQVAVRTQRNRAKLRRQRRKGEL